MFPFASDWMRRYRWIARSKGPKHELAFWRGLAEGIWRTAASWRRSPVSSSAFEQFSQLEKIRNEMARIAADGQIRSILLLDVGKNIFAYWRAARLAGLRIVAIADSRLAVPGRRYQGVPVLSDDRARLLAYDAAVVANTSPIHAALRVTEWQRHDIRPVIDLLAQSRQSIVSAA